MYAAPKPNYPIATAETLPKYDGILFGIPTRFGSVPAQWKACSLDHRGR
jgi:NAD(P)H dehydrogenase (quinone)